MSIKKITEKIDNSIKEIGEEGYISVTEEHRINRNNKTYGVEVKITSYENLRLSNRFISNYEIMRYSFRKAIGGNNVPELLGLVILVIGVILNAEKIMLTGGLIMGIGMLLKMIIAFSNGVTKMLSKRRC